VLDHPQAPPPPPGRPGETLEDRIYRPSLAGEGRGLPRPSPWATVPAALAVCAGLGAVALLLGRRAAAAPEATVEVVLQEGPEPPPAPRSAPAHAAAPAPAPAPAPGPATPVPAPPAPAPAPERPQPAPPAPAQEAAPDAAPRELPRVDQSRLYGGNAGGGAAAGAGGGGEGSGSGAGATGAGTGPGGPPGQVAELEFAQVRVKFRPPPPEYPPLARRAQVQGTVVVQVEVDTSGVPTSARALQGPFLLRAPAEAYAMAWRFYPYVRNGVPCPSRFILTMPFTLTASHLG